MIVKVDPKHEGKSKEELLAVLDEEIANFSRHMMTIDPPEARGALSNPEKALLKTYLVAKLRERF
jgi:hypothetical protein